MSIFTDIFGCATLQLCNFLPRLPRFLLCLCPVLGSFSPELGSAAVFSSRRYSAALMSFSPEFAFFFAFFAKKICNPTRV